MAGLHLALEAQREGQWLTLTFSDDGIASGNGKPGFGVGLANLEQRVRRFGGAEASMSTSTRGGRGFAVTLRWRAAAEITA
jgi:signal transduction histidine kinase